MLQSFPHAFLEQPGMHGQVCFTNFLLHLTIPYLSHRHFHFLHKVRKLFTIYLAYRTIPSILSTLSAPRRHPCTYIECIF